MPRKKQYKKKRYGRNSYKSHQTIQRTPNTYGLSDSQIVKMKYVDKFSLDPTYGAVDSYVFRANSCYDPNLTGTGHQPYPFDQLMEFYTSFIVLGAKIKVTFSGQASGQSQYIVGVQLKDSATVDQTSATLIIEQGRAKWKTLTSGAGSTTTTQVVTKGFSPKKFYGVPDLNDSIYKGSSSSNPTEDAHFHVIAAQLNESAVYTGLDCMAEIEYLVQLRDPRPLSGS